MRDALVVAAAAAQAAGGGQQRQQQQQLLMEWGTGDEEFEENEDMGYEDGDDSEEE